MFHFHTHPAGPSLGAGSCSFHSSGPRGARGWESCLGLELDPGQRGQDACHLQIHPAKGGVPALPAEDSWITSQGVLVALVCSFLFPLLLPNVANRLTETQTIQPKKGQGSAVSSHTPEAELSPSTHLSTSHHDQLHLVKLRVCPELMRLGKGHGEPLPPPHQHLGTCSKASTAPSPH